MGSKSHALVRDAYPRLHSDRATAPKIAALSAAVATCFAVTTGAQAQQPEGLEEIVITGSRIVRRDLNAPSPILTVDTEAFEQSSNVSIEYVLNQYPQFQPDDTQFAASDIQPTANNTPGTSTLNLRGLGASRTLVLLDGRRAQPVNGAMTIDVNTLPAAALAGVEVISGGAAATYGPDAMAGVVNFKLRNDFEGINLNYQQGFTGAGDGEESRLDGLIGGNFGDGRGNAMVGIGYAQREIAYELDRDFFAARMTDNGTGANYIRTDWPNYIPTTGNLPTQAAVNSVMPLPNQSRSSAFFVNPATGSVFRTTAALASGYDGPTTAPYLIREHNGNLEQNNPRGWLSSPMTRRMVFGRATYDITDTISMFVQGSYNKSDVEQLLAPTPLATGVPVQRNPGLEPLELRTLLDSRALDPDGTGPLPVGAPGSGASQPYTLARTLYWWPNRGSSSDTEVGELVVGINGEFGSSDWTWEAYHQNGTTEVLTSMDNFVWEDRYRALALQPNFGRGGSITVASANESTVTRTLSCTSGLPLLEPYNWTPDYDIVYPSGFQLSQDCIEAITVDMLQRNTIKQSVTEANFQGKLADLRAGELRGAFGVSKRNNYSLFENDPLYIATERAEGETEVNELYGEILYPVFGEFELEIGARMSDFKTGSDWSLDAKSYKALFNWSPTDSWRFRGGWQRANRVPNVAELFAGQTSQVFGWGATHDVCMNVTLHPYGNRADNPNRPQVQELCRQLIYASGGVPGANDFDIQGASNYPNDGRALPDSYRLITGGNPQLDAETADTWTIGFVWRSQGPNLSVSMDLYDIQIDNVVGSLGFLSAYEQCFNANGVSNPTYSVSNEYCQRITRDPVDAEPLLVYGGNFNLSERHTAGVDFTVDWSKDLAGGTFGVRTSANLLDEWQQPVLSAPDAPLFEYAGYGQYFDTRLFTSLSWGRDRYDIGLNWRHLSSQQAEARVQTPESTVLPTDAYNLFSLNASFRLNERIRLRGGIDNLLAEDPPLTGRNPDNPTQPTNGAGVTDRGNYDVLGRRYFVGLAVDF